MKWTTVVLLLSVGLVAFGQTASYPTAIADDEALGVAKDQAATNLTAALDSSSLTVYVANGSVFAEKQIIYIDSEKMQICTISGNTLTLCSGSRGFDGSVATSHSAGRRVSGEVAAYYHNALREEVQAIETALGANLENFTASLNPGTLTEISEPDSPAANALKLYAKDVSGVTYACFKNSDGEEICIAPDGVQTDSTDPTVFTGKNQTGTLTAPGTSGFTALAFAPTTGTPVWRTNGGSEKTAVSTDVVASDSASGLVELATAAETSTGTATDRAVTPDGLAGSVHGQVVIQAPVFDWTTNTAIGDGKFYIFIPAKLNGMNLTAVHAQVITAGSTNTTDIQIARCAAVTSGNVCSGTVEDMLSTKLTIDSGEDSSDTAASAAVINTSNDDVATNQVLRVDVDAVHTTPAKGLIVTLTLNLP